MHYFKTSYTHWPFKRQLVVFFMAWCGCAFSLSAQEFEKYIPQEEEIALLDNADNLKLHFSQPWKYKVGDDTLWKEINLDETGWKTIPKISDAVHFSDDTTLSRETGIVWFRSRFRADSNLVNKPLGLYLEQDGSAAEVYMDGIFMASFGKVGTDIESEDAQFGRNSKPFAFTLSKLGEHSIAVRFSSYHNRLLQLKDSEGQPWFHIYTKDLNRIVDQLYNSSRFFPIIFLFGIFLTLGTIHSLFFFYMRTDRLNLFFGLYCIGIAFVFYYDYYITSKADYEVFHYLSQIASFIAPVITVPLVALYHSIYYHRLSRFFWFILVLYLIVVLTNLLQYKIADFLSVIIVAGSIIEIFRINIRSLIKKRDGAYILGLGILMAPISIIMLVVVATFDEGKGVDDWYEFTFLYCIVLSIPFSFTLFQARSLARLNRSMKLHVIEIEELSKKTIEQEQEKKRILEVQNTRLESMVTERTEELKQRQQQLIQSEKMASVGLLTAGVAHEINNPINFVSGNITPLKRDIDELLALLEKYTALDQKNFMLKLPEILKLRNEMDLDYTTSEIKSLINGIEQGSRRTAEIVKGLRNFSRLDEEEMKPGNINECISSTLLLLQNKLRHQNIEVIKSLGEIPAINCYPGPLNQVFMNVLTNAIDAMDAVSEISTLVPSVQPTSAGDKKLFITTWLENKSVKISIRDTGTGMSEEIKKKIFDPFFTTKEVGKGTGLGLSITYGIIQKHQGFMEVKSTLGKGTEFIITLPFQTEAHL